MPFYATAYDTTVGRGVNINKIMGAVKIELLRENFAMSNNHTPGIDLPVWEDGCTPSIVTTLTEGEMSIPVFAHPLFVDLSDVRKSDVENYMISDARPFMVGKPINSKGELVAKNKTEFDFTKNRTLLSAHWYKREVNSFKFLSPCLLGIFASWVSEGISRRFGLDPKDQQYIAVLAAYHYLSLFSFDSKFDENDHLKMAPAIVKATYADIETVLDLLGRFPTMEGIHDLCEHIKEATENPRLDDLNPGLLVTMISTSWIGTNSRDIASVALEHVPTFVMMVFGSFTERSYRHASLSKIAERYRGRKGEDEFIRSLKALVTRLKNP